LSNSKGRQRANQSALGIYSTRASTILNTEENRYRTKILVPYISIDNWMQQFILGGVSQNRSETYPDIRIRSSVGTYLASWVNLLSDIDTTWIMPENPIPGKFMFTETQTDSLPDDVYAAPCSITIEGAIT
jgi:hypothetical protein